MGMGSDDVSWTYSCVFHRVEGLLGMADLGWVGSTPHRISSPSRLVWDHSYGEQEEQERADICKTLDMPPLLPHPTGKTVKRQTPDSRVGETDSISWWLTEPHCKVFRETEDIFCSQSPTGFNPTPKSRWKAVTFSNILNHAHFLAISPVNAISVPKPSVSYWLGRYKGSRIEQIKECLLLGWGDTKIQTACPLTSSL